MTKFESASQPGIGQHYGPDDEIDLRELFTTLWRGKWIMIVATIAFTVGAGVYVLCKPNIYQASVLLAPSQEDSRAVGVGGQLGGLASLAGINLSGGDSNKTVMAKQVLQSRAFLTDFMHRHNLSVPLMATKGWDMESQEWLVNGEVYDPRAREWLQGKDGKSQKPTDWDMVKKFKEEHLSISENKDTGMVTVSIKSQSPIAAQQWAEKLVQDINEHMRQQDVEDAEARIAYLEEKLSETNIAGMQQVFYQLIESETRTVMLANAQNEYIFKTVDPAVVPQEKSEPNRALIVVLAVVLGGMLGVFVVFVRVFLSGRSAGNASNANISAGFDERA
ncbi:LPS O-antigen chain length determinant protein, WzzB/FepE family [Marinobacter sp. es.048]|uniref:Wzz/FepE/Etk N-terminal domain-containing protein n=1 Tax=Marinobacter sp. es.048 TaxID=1761795 RepID=UPI000B5979CF|nr:Wzz/FepE/Etk N-terminal domain-containing protein [Marinobacter sp. es.048]SNC66931.1 LPS O-antigen chain length determinant protein, WzzB/FepE family [Marinobacter sp. es.048]